MYVLFTLVVLSLHSLFRSRQRTLESRDEEEKKEPGPHDCGCSDGRSLKDDPRNFPNHGSQSSRGEQTPRVRPENVPDSRKSMQDSWFQTVALDLSYGHPWQHEVSRAQGLQCWDVQDVDEENGFIVTLSTSCQSLKQEPRSAPC
ncbi:hypothetical protein AAFF_G00227260 [Aldrovandia affinis]|uniref:Uncharacterized protein n=1 Tax=Aldrovandia affinis TaxID=143900 RepID=A0AAD7X2L2_9TELE|nr:hypothetical protein AAFF_G00227260 [Aldrovandia affinis]